MLIIYPFSKVKGGKMIDIEKINDIKLLIAIKSWLKSKESEIGPSSPLRKELNLKMDELDKRLWYLIVSEDSSL